ncbi:MAG: cyclic nucleotide-binding domain-containing protein [Steroidobacteraceae bacterium]|jgi:CRP-like cAMP-binding protein
MTTAIDAVRNSPLASELSPSEVQVLAGVLTIRELKDGEVLLPEGSRDSNLHVIVSGQIEVVQISEDQGRRLLYRLEPGDLVGELSFMDDEPRFAALIASGRTEVLVLARGDFETLIEPSPQVVYKVMRAIMRVARRVQRRLSVQVREMENYIYRTGAKFVA